MTDNGIAWMINDARRVEGDRWLVESAQQRELRQIVAEAAGSGRGARIGRIVATALGRRVEENVRRDDRARAGYDPACCPA